MVLGIKPEVRQPYGKSKCRQRDNIKMDLKGIGWKGWGLDSYGLGQRPGWGPVNAVINVRFEVLEPSPKGLTDLYISTCLLHLAFPLVLSTYEDESTTSLKTLGNTKPATRNHTNLKNWILHSTASLGISWVTEDHNEVGCVDIDWIHQAVEKKLKALAYTVMNFWFWKNMGISSLAEKPLDSQEGLYSMEFWLVVWSGGWLVGWLVSELVKPVLLGLLLEINICFITFKSIPHWLAIWYSNKINEFNLVECHILN